MDPAALQPRRKDRAVHEEAWMRDLLARAPAGTVALLREGKPFLNANIFVHDPAAKAIYTHTAREGATRGAAEVGGPACFAAFEMGRILPAKRAVGFSAEYASVLASGTLDVVRDEAEATHALRLLMAKYAPHLEYGKDYDGVSAEDLARTTVYRLRIEGWSGKRNAKPVDFPGAYRFGERPSPAPLRSVETP